MVKNCDLGLQNSVISRPLSQFFTIRTSQLANNIHIYIYPNRSIYFLAYFQDVNEGSASSTRVWQISSSNFYSDGVFISKKERDMYLNYLYYVVNQA